MRPGVGVSLGDTDAKGQQTGQQATTPFCEDRAPLEPVAPLSSIVAFGPPAKRAWLAGGHRFDPGTLQRRGPWKQGLF